MVNVGLREGGIRHHQLTTSNWTPQCNQSSIDNPGSHISHYLRALNAKY